MSEDSPYSSEEEFDDFIYDEFDGGKEVDELVVEDEDESEDNDESDEKDVDEFDEKDEEEEEIPLDLKKVSNYNKEEIIVKNENRRTSSILSKYEMSEIVSIRATQISKFPDCFVDISGLDDPIKMAKRELMMRKCPLNVRRVVGEVKNPKTGEIETYVERWCPNEMTFAVAYDDVM